MYLKEKDKIKICLPNFSNFSSLYPFMQSKNSPLHKYHTRTMPLPELREQYCAGFQSCHLCVVALPVLDLACSRSGPDSCCDDLALCSSEPAAPWRAYLQPNCAQPSQIKGNRKILCRQCWYKVWQFKNETGILLQRVNGGEWNAGEICWPWSFWNAVGVVLSRYSI